MNIPERLLFSAAAYDERVATRFEAFGTRNIDPRRFLPTIVPSVIAAHARHRLGGIATRSPEAPNPQPSA